MVKRLSLLLIAAAFWAAFSVGVPAQSTLNGLAPAATDSSTVKKNDFDLEAAELYKRAGVRSVTITGTGDGIIATSANVAVTELSDGLEVDWVATANNTGAATFDLDTLPGTPDLRDATGAALAANQIVSGTTYTSRYILASTHWRIVTGLGGVTDGDKGDITISGVGSSYQIDADAVGAPEIAAAAVGTSEADGLDAGDITTGAFADARVDGSLESDEVVPTLVGDVDGASNANDLDEAAVETELEGVIDLADLQGDLALGTKTSGNYQSGNTAGTGIAITQTPAEAFSSTVALDYSDAGASPALNADECRFTNNVTAGRVIVCEGDTPDAFESGIFFTEPTADRVMTVPNADSNTVQPLTCSGSDKVSAISAAGVVTCTADSGAAGGDSVSVNGSAATDADLDDATPAAPSNGVNIKWQKDAGSPNNVSAYFDVNGLTTDSAPDMAADFAVELDVSATTPKKVLLGKIGAGAKTIFIPAGALVARTTNGCAPGAIETTTNKVMIKTCDFNPTTQQFAQFSFMAPKSWNESTLTAFFPWSHAATTTNFGVVWALECQAYSDTDAGDTAFGTAQQIADTGGTTNAMYITAVTPAISVGSTPAENDLVICQVKRVPADGSDTMAIDARLQGVKLILTTDANTDN